MTDKTESADDAAKADPEAAEADDKPKSKPKKSALKEGAILMVIAVGLYYVMLTFVARPYLIPSQSMEPTLHGCPGCTGDRVMVDKLTYRFGEPKPGDVIVFKGPPNWNTTYKSIRSKNTAVRWLQNALSFVGFVPPDENDLVKRVIAVGGQKVECNEITGLTVDGKPLNQPFLDPKTMGTEKMTNQSVASCMINPFSLTPMGWEVTVPEGRLWVMGDNRTQSSDSRAHCTSAPQDARRRVLCTGDPMSGTIPVENVIGKARFIAWPPSRWGGVSSVDIQSGE